MAGMLVAEGAFGRIGWDTKTEKKLPMFRTSIFSLSLKKLVLNKNSNFLGIKNTWHKMEGQAILHLTQRDLFFK